MHEDVGCLRRQSGRTRGAFQSWIKCKCSGLCAPMWQQVDMRPPWHYVQPHNCMVWLVGISIHAATPLEEHNDLHPGVDDRQM